MSERVKGINIPIVITADGTKAVAGLKRFEKQATQLDGIVGKWAIQQTRGIAAMAGAWLSLDSLVAGVRALYEASHRISKIAGTYNASVAQAQAGVTVASIHRDQRVATAVAPLEAERAQRSSEFIRRDSTKAEQLASAAGWEIDLIRRQAVLAAEAFGEFASLDFAKGMETMDRVKTGREELWNAVTSGAGIGGTGGMNDAALAAQMRAQSLRELQEIVRQTRGQR